MKKFETMKIHSETNYDVMNDVEQMIFDCIMYHNECDVYPTVKEIIENLENVHNERLTEQEVKEVIEKFEQEEYVREV